MSLWQGSEATGLSLGAAGHYALSEYSTLVQE